MKYENSDSSFMQRNHWTNGRVSFYANNWGGDTWELEIAIRDNNKAPWTVYRIANTMDFDEATETIANLLEVFDNE